MEGFSYQTAKDAMQLAAVVSVILVLVVITVESWIRFGKGLWTRYQATRFENQWRGLPSVS